VHDGTVPVSLDKRGKSLERLAPSDFASTTLRVTMGGPGCEAIEVLPHAKGLLVRSYVDERVPKTRPLYEVHGHVDKIIAILEALRVQHFQKIRTGKAGGESSEQHRGAAFHVYGFLIRGLAADLCIRRLAAGRGLACWTFDQGGKAKLARR